MGEPRHLRISIGLGGTGTHDKRENSSLRLPHKTRQHGNLYNKRGIIRDPSRRREYAGVMRDYCMEFPIKDNMGYVLRNCHRDVFVDRAAKIHPPRCGKP